MLLGCLRSAPLLRYLRAEELIEAAGDHAVVESADLVGPAAVQPLKAFVGGEDVDLPGLKAGKAPSHVTVELLHRLGGHQPLSVRGIADNGAPTVGLGDGADVGLEYLQVGRYPGAAGVFLRQCHAGGIDVGCPHLKGGFLINGRDSLVPGVVPIFPGDPGVFLGGKLAAKAGGGFGLEHGGLDGNGARAAGGIPKEDVLAGACGHGQGGGQGLPQGSGIGGGAIPSFVEGYTGGVDHQGDFIFEQEEFHLVLDPRLVKPALAVSTGETADNGLFDDALAVGHRKQGAFDGVSLYGEGVVRPDEILPGQGGGAVEELGEGVGRETPQHKIYPLRGAQLQITAGHGIEGGTEIYPPVHGLGAVTAKGIQLATKQLFQPEETGGGKIVFGHKFSSFVGFVAHSIPQSAPFCKGRRDAGAKKECRTCGAAPRR